VAYERLRRSRVEKIAARGAKINHAKAPRPLARKRVPLFLPLMFRMMDVEKTVGEETRYTIDWAQPVQRKLKPSPELSTGVSL
jgi:hypothetical protein